MVVDRHVDAVGSSQDRGCGGLVAARGDLDLDDPTAGVGASVEEDLDAPSVVDRSTEGLDRRWGEDPSRVIGGERGRGQGFLTSNVSFSRVSFSDSRSCAMILNV
jgi:hypothetical protein